MDELVALTDAADAQDVQPVQVGKAHVAGVGPTTAKVAQLLAEGRRGNEIAVELGLAKSTVAWHIKRLGIKGPRDYVGRRAIVATLGGAGLRSASCATSSSGRSACTTRTGHACGSATPRRRPALARCR
jgi:hypothetical protein